MRPVKNKRERSILIQKLQYRIIKQINTLSYIYTHMHTRTHTNTPIRTHTHIQTHTDRHTHALNAATADTPDALRVEDNFDLSDTLLLEVNKEGFVFFADRTAALPDQQESMEAEI